MITPAETRYEAWFYDGVTAARQEAVLDLQPDGVYVVRPGTEPLLWPYGGVTLDNDGRHGEPVRLSWGVQSAVVLVDGGFVDALRQYAPEVVRPGFHLSGWPRVIMACIGVAVAAGVMYVWGLRVAAEFAAQYAPPVVEDRLGRAVVKALAPPDQDCHHAEREKLLARIAQRLEAAEPAARGRFHITYTRSAVPNAFAAPGGYIVVCQGLLRHMETPEELAGVLAHEMQHVLKKHAARNVARDLSGRALLSILIGDPSGAATAERVASLVTLRYQRSEEAEADAGGIELLARAKIRGDGLTSLLTRLHSSGDAVDLPLSYLSTHPGFLERTAELSRLARARIKETQPLLSQAEWAEAKKVCAAN